MGKQDLAPRLLLTLSYHDKKISKWIKTLDVRPKIAKILEVNTGK